ncbi:acyl-CoA thioester hydrolase, YbgC/YbaW family domain protein [Acinetobacter baumannii 44327_8]|nr:acyl-CoA thioester hydrolase, YbgC/YbaW family domain protein [Acinetobacter baumannii 44327_6]EXW51041.1 acyl-CoA thioester hydrolase, YbgC/YbaW family domain protein [Acinetobacter baumannii 44467_8]EXW51717.1 acyl-CoA thioester hydrolase, YbgC/YbaW family domain protein [Acinetobacter baumannii 44467_7]EXW62284.1 acyl-CoA thioester hydrolase, YbgC/YbaW family domain protein [Acinetobacter baumannii 44467_5]EXW64206.1 acyl-CoA thioester hydrolase, YbgC/YbaW family domain protein [Acinetoba
MDAFGHVNNVQYYRYIESSRILYMENVNILTPNIGRVKLEVRHKPPN